MTRSKIKGIRDNDKQVLMEVEHEKIEMTLNTESSVATGLLTQRLTELYDDPVQATIRETISNAIDAVVVSSEGRPTVKITSPSAFSPVFIVEDNGIGMSYEDLKNVYAKYGASTKMDDLSQIGAYGLGAKAPLSYGNEFTVTSVKDGVKTIILVAREEISNFIKVISSEPTDEPSGTVVSVPIESDDLHRFTSNIEKYKSTPLDQDIDLYVDNELYNNERFVCMDGIPLQREYNEVTNELDITLTGRLWFTPEMITEMLLLRANSRLRSDVRFVIGSWAYRAPSSSHTGWYSAPKDNIYIELKTGLVSFNSSRDAIIENERYNEFEDTVFKYLESGEFRARVIRHIADEDFDVYSQSLLELLREFNDEIDVSTLSIPNNKYRKDEGEFIKLSELKHKETGYDIAQIVDSLSKHNTISSYAEEKEAHKVTTDSLKLKIEVPSVSGGRYIWWSPSTIKEINEEITENVDTGHLNVTLGDAMLSLLHKVGHSKQKGNIGVVVTDVNADNVNKIKSIRKNLVRSALKRAKASEEAYAAHIILTDATKVDLEDDFNEINRLVNNNMLVTAEEAIKMATTYASTIKKEPKRKKFRLETMLHDVERSRLDDSMIDPSKNNVIIMSRDYIGDQHTKAYITWYSEVNNVDKDDFDLYFSIGTHRNADIDILEELGEVYVCEYSDTIGTSQRASEYGRSRVARRTIIKQNDPNAIAKAAALYARNYITAYNNFINVVQYAQEQIQIANNAFDLNVDDKSSNELVELIVKGVRAIVDELDIDTQYFTRLEVKPSHYDKYLTDELKAAINAIAEINQGGSPYRDIIGVRFNRLSDSLIETQIKLEEPRVKAQIEMLKIYLTWMTDTIKQGLTSIK